jgi:hypothetical protein
MVPHRLPFRILTAEPVYGAVSGAQETRKIEFLTSSKNQPSRTSLPKIYGEGMSARTSFEAVLSVPLGLTALVT